MSALLPSDRSQWWAPSETICLYCLEPVPPDGVAVNWCGAQHIILHPECAARLGCHLIADSREAHLASGQRPWTRRAAIALRSAVQAEEARS